MEKNLFTKALFAMGAVALMASCAKSTDLFNQESIDAQKKADAQAGVEQLKLAYAENFVKKYGAVDPNQSWDFTTGAKLGAVTRTVDNSSQGATQIQTQIVDGLKFITGKDWLGRNTYSKNNYAASNSLYQTIKTLLKDGQQHQGAPVVLSAPTSDFYIFPVTVQGYWKHDLKVKVGDQNAVTLYSKDWVDFDAPSYNGYNGRVMKGIHVHAPIGTPIDVYLDNVRRVDTDKWGRTTTTNKPSVGTFNGQAIYVNTSNNMLINPGFDLKSNAVIKCIGIEDNNGNDSDNDYNDVTLVVVGNPDVPGEIPVTEEEYTVPCNVSKRYLIEDLGGSDDFDFNDIVVDVYQNITQKWKRKLAGDIEISNEYVSTEYGPQEAIIRAMGGTLDFTVTIGSTRWTKSTGVPFDTNLTSFNIGTMYNTQSGFDYDKVLAKFTVTGWNPDDNNISVEVVKNVDTSVDNDHIIYEIPFPKKGDIPMIVAVDATEAWAWMKERQSVPDWWIKNGDDTVHIEDEEVPVEE